MLVRRRNPVKVIHRGQTPVDKSPAAGLKRMLNVSCPRGGCMSPELFRIDSRYCGPPRSGHGGYVCGRVADYVEVPKSAFGAS
jgi:hypothetical protein